MIEGIVITPAENITNCGPYSSNKYPAKGNANIPTKAIIMLSTEPIVALNLFGMNL